MDHHKDSNVSSRGSAVQSRVARPRARVSESVVDPAKVKNTCPICFSELTDICAYQPCTHVLCFECAVRNRVLCNKKECPVCRTECEQVVLAGHRFNDESDNVHRFDAVQQNAQKNQGRSDPCYGFLFENISIERAYRKMLTHACRFCDRPFNEFDELVRHVRERHEQHYCNVCVRTLMLFTWEHKVYMYDELLRHMDEGDPGDKKILPHPLCELCRYRAFDVDDLFRHSKKRHQVCWICERTSNKLVFFNDFFSLYDHMAHNHYVCKICSKPEEARVTSFPDEPGLEIHLATDHTDGAIRPDVLFNFQQRGGPDRGGRQRRGHEDRHDEDEENVRPRSPVRQNFNMDSAQFPTLGDVSSVPPTGGATLNHPSVSTGAEQTKPIVKYAPPKMTENDFPSLGGCRGGTTAKNAPSTSWANGSAKVTAPAFATRTTAAVPKKMTRNMPAASSSAPISAAVTGDMFPALSGPAPAAVAKLSRDWTAVPVKNKKNETKKNEAKKNETVPLSSRWDLPEEASEPRPQASHSGPRSSNESSQAVFVQHKRSNGGSGGGGFDGTQNSSDLFPSLAKPEGKALPSLFRSTPAKKKSGKSSVIPSKTSPAQPVKKSEKDEIAETLFRSVSRDLSDEEEGAEPSHSNSMAATLTHTVPYAMKIDDFPGLEKAKPRPKIFVPERKSDRVQKHKEIKSDWGNTVVQYETVFIYIPPPNAEERQVALHSKLEPVEVKGKNKILEDFQTEFLEEKISALEFWMESQRILGKKFASLMPEVIVLLRSVSHQQEIFEVAKVPIYGNVQVVKALTQCAVCKQIVRNGIDKEEHDRVHKNSR